MSGFLRNRVLLPATGVLIVLAVWEATVVFYKLPPIVLPSPWAVLATLADLVRTYAFWRDVAVSLYEFVTGYAIGVVLGIAVGLLIGEWRIFRLTATPVANAPSGNAAL